MPIEIERKFLVNSDVNSELLHPQIIKQGYIATHQQGVVRVRIIDTNAFLTIKGQTKGMTRSEFEYSIPLSDADQLLETICRSPIIEKLRYQVPFMGRSWIVDVFQGENNGLMIAEIELETEDQIIKFPPWIEREVTHDFRYSNSNLVDHPYCQW